MTPPANSAFEVRTRLHGNRVVITVVGELDIATASDLRSAADEAWPTHPSGLVIEVAGMTFCDSVGIGALVYVLKGCRDRGMQLALAGASLRTQSLLRIIGLLSRFDRFASVDEALMSSGKAPQPLEPA